jgi:carbonic anhydrase
MLVLALQAAAADPPSPPHWVYTHKKDGSSDGSAQHETWGAWGPICPIGRMQSPINIVTKDVAIATHLSDGVVPDFSPMPLVAKNSGHAFQAEPAPGAPKAHTNIRGDDFAFVQAHWHAPSEHTIDGVHAALEGHFVHQSTDPDTATGLAVIGVLFETTEACNPVLEKFWDAFPIDGSVQGPGVMPKGKPTDEVDLMQLLTPALADGYFHYTGSLTTPPCTEGVDWNLAKGVLSVCQAQLDRLKQGLESVQDGVGINNRATQPVFQRDVTTSPSASIGITARTTSLFTSLAFGVRQVREGAIALPALFIVVMLVAGIAIRSLLTVKRRKLAEPLLAEARYVSA